MTAPAGTSLVWPLYVAVAAVLLGDAGVAPLLGGDKVYNIAAPVGAAFDYIVLGGVSEDELWAFTQGGSTATLTLHLWTAGEDARTCAQLFGHVHRALNRASLALAGFGASTCVCRLVDIQPDPGVQYMHGIVRLECAAIRA
jgi:hypothetical protein